jgi:hypothetical protein
MDVRRSFYFAPGQGDLAEAASEESRLDYDDIPLVPPANDNFRPKSRLSWGNEMPFDYASASGWLKAGVGATGHGQLKALPFFGVARLSDAEVENLVLKGESGSPTVSKMTSTSRLARPSRRRELYKMTSGRPWLTTRRLAELRGLN